MDKPTLQKILRRHKDELFQELKLPYFQIKALKKLSICRTAELGGHAEYCENGHLDGVWYNSCRHRSCPQCQNLAKAQWLENTQRILLNCPHHHVIFTIPHELNELWRHNRAQMGSFVSGCAANVEDFCRRSQIFGCEAWNIVGSAYLGQKFSLASPSACIDQSWRPGYQWQLGKPQERQIISAKAGDDDLSREIVELDPVGVGNRTVDTARRQGCRSNQESIKCVGKKRLDRAFLQSICSRERRCQILGALCKGRRI